MGKLNPQPFPNLCIQHRCVYVCIFCPPCSEQFPWMSLSQTRHLALAEQLWADVKLCEVSLISERLSGSVHTALRGICSHTHRQPSKYQQSMLALT